MQHGNLVPLQNFRCADHRQLQQLGRADGPRGKNYFAARLDQAFAGGAADVNASATPAFEAQPQGMRMVADDEVGALFYRLQKCAPRMPAHAALLRDFEPSAAGVVTRIEIVGAGYAGLRRGVGESIQDFPRQALFLDAHLAAAGVKVPVATMAVLVPLEIR